MTIAERTSGSVVILDLAGRLVLDDGDGRLKERVAALVGQGTRQVVLNVADLSYVDSAGLGALVSVCLSLKNCGGGVKVLCPSTRLLELLKMARLLNVVDTCDSESRALADFGAVT